MLKRMIVMLVVMAAIIARPRFREVPTDSDGDRAGRGVSAAAGSRHHHRGEAEEWPDTLSAIGTMAAVQGVDVSADLPGPSIESRSTLADLFARATCSFSSTRARNVPSWLPPKLNAISRVSISIACRVC